RRVSTTVGAMPPGPAIYFVSGDDSLFPALYERFVAGARPDVIVLEPELCRDRWFLEWAKRTLPAIEYPFIDGPGVPPPIARGIAAINAGRARIGGDDWRLAPGVAHPFGRGYLFGPGPEPDAEPPPPYTGDLGARVAGRIGLVRGMYEAARGRLPAAARAAGLDARFGEALPAPRSDRPPLAPRVPRTTPSFIFEPWERALFGDDLAWSAGLPAPELPVDTARERFVHRAWRGVLEGALEPAELDGLSAEELAILGGLLARGGQPDRARAAYQRALAADPALPGLRQALDRLGRE
ncbi:MAG TPA: hypothetical protein VML75_11910, partial [Kofleriaceae bacterium]|nr:hypothetical protein [Kofleriaceae bacterium]